MSTNIQNQPQTLVNDRKNNFNFELWAKEVKPQLIAALKKRAEK